MPRYIFQQEAAIKPLIDEDLSPVLANLSFVNKRRSTGNKINDKHRMELTNIVSLLTGNDQQSAQTLVSNLSDGEVSNTFIELNNLISDKIVSLNAGRAADITIARITDDETAKNRISTEQAQEFEDKFVSKRKRYFIPNDILNKFIKKSEELIDAFRTATGDTDHDLAFRMYLGHDGAGISDRTYSIVIVPIATLKVFTNPVLRHSHDKEKTLFANAGRLFFALVLTVVDGAPKIELRECTEDGAGCLHIIEECKKMLINEDENGPTLIFHTHQDMDNFIKGLAPNPGTMVKSLEVEFGRNDKDRLIVILTFFSDSGDIVFSSFNSSNFSGICFDEGDLIPPPPGAIADSYLK
jgi:hypothetical protein